jgi:hypothetical protein
MQGDANQRAYHRDESAFTAQGRLYKYALVTAQKFQPTAGDFYCSAAKEVRCNCAAERNRKMRMGNIVSGREPEVPSLDGSLLSIDYAARPWRRHNNAQPPHD